MCKVIKQGELIKEIEKLEDGQMLQITFGESQEDKEDETVE